MSMLNFFSSLPYSNNKVINTQNEFDNFIIAENDNIILNGDFVGSLDIDQQNVTIKGGSISGGEDISGLTWADEGGDIWSTSMVTDPKWINIAGVSAKLAQVPLITITSRPANNQVGINAGDVSGFTNIVGSYFVSIDRNFSYSVRFEVTAYSAGVITLDVDLPFAETGQKFYLLNDEEYFDSNNEWIWRSNTLKIKSTVDPSTLTITRSIHDYGLNITSVNCNVLNVTFKEQYNYAIYGQANSLNISGCTLLQIRGEGVYIPTQIININISSNTISNIGHNGIWFGPCVNVICNNNTISDIGVGLNIGWNNHTSTTTGQTSGTGMKFNIDVNEMTHDAGNLTMENNTIDNTAYNNMSLHIGSGGSIKRNVVSNPHQILSDGGAIYCFHFRDTNIPFNNFIIEENFVSDLIAGDCFGIYMDNRCRNNELRHNVIFNSFGNGGMMINADTEAHNVHDNTIYVNATKALWYRDWPAPSKIYANDQNLINDNILIVRVSGDNCLEFSDSVNPYNNSGAGDNNFYINPYGTVVLNDGSDKTLSQLQSTYSQDASSTEHTNYITAPGDPDNEILLVTNPNDSVLNGTAPAGTWKDVDEVVTTNYSIQPWRSLVLLKDLP